MITAITVCKEARRQLEKADTWVQAALFLDQDDIDEELGQDWQDLVERINTAITERIEGAAV